MAERATSATLSGTDLEVVCYDHANLHVCVQHTRDLGRATVVSLTRGPSGAWEPTYVCGRDRALRNVPLALQLIADLTGDLVIMADKTYRPVVPR